MRYVVLGYNPGDAPSPAIFTSKGDSGSTMQSILAALRSDPLLPTRDKVESEVRALGLR
jgi:hypothetical protein